MERHPEVGLVFSDYRDFLAGAPSAISHFETCPILWPQLKNRNEMVLENACAILTLENFGIAGSYMARRSLVNLEKGFDPSLKACEDFHFYFRLARHTPVGVVNKIGMLRRLHGDNMSSNPWKMYSEGIRSRTLLRDSEQDPSIRTQLEKYIASRQRALARIFADSGLYVKSLQQDMKVLSGPFFWQEVRSACRNVMRTLILASGLQKNWKKKVAEIKPEI
jgi:hypothetical protein